MRFTRRTLGIALLAGLAATGLAHASPRYGIKDLGTLGGSYSGSLSLNQNANVVGYSQIAGASLIHGFVSDPVGMHDLGTLGGEQSLARAINGFGHIVGWSITATGDRHAFLYGDGIMIDLGTLGGSPSDAHGINDLDQIVGSYVNGGYELAFLWQHGVMSDLGTLGGTDSRAYAINRLGDVAGFARPLDNSELHACLWHNGVPQDLGTLGGWASHAYDINDFGKAVGWTMEVPNHISHGFVWTNATMIDMGTIGGVYSAAFAINNAGEVVGVSSDSTEQTHAVYALGGPPWTDLNSLIAPNSGWFLASANDINENGQIVGVGAYNDVQHAFLLTPLPPLSVDPAPAALAFTGATPNPAFGRTNLRFSLPAAARVSLRLFDVSGRVVRTLADGAFGAGPASIEWDGRDDDGVPLRAGLYWARFETPGLRSTTRLTLLR